MQEITIDYDVTFNDYIDPTDWRSINDLEAFIREAVRANNWQSITININVREDQYYDYNYARRGRESLLEV